MTRGATAPTVIGHPATDDPAFGEIRSLRVDRGTLLATVDRVEFTLKQAVRASRN